MNNLRATILIFILIILLALSAFFSAAETAYSTYNPARMKTLAEKKKKAKLVLKLNSNYDSVLSTLLIGNNIVNITAASVATVLFTFYFGNIGVTLSTIVMTVVVLIFGEISPKSLAKERPEAFAMFIARPLHIFTIIFTPLIYIFNGWKKLLNKLFRLDKKRPTFTEEEFKIIVTDIKNEGVINQIEHDLIQNSILYDETRVSEVMVNRIYMTLINESQTLAEIKKIFDDTNYSRIPIYRENINNIIGIIYLNDFYEMLLNSSRSLSEIIRKPIFTLPDIKISYLLKRFQKLHQHMAIVKDREKNTLGLITMEDILEEIVGEIEDEYDDE